MKTLNEFMTEASDKAIIGSLSDQIRKSAAIKSSKGFKDYVKNTLNTEYNRENIAREFKTTEKKIKSAMDAALKMALKSL